MDDIEMLTGVKTRLGITHDYHDVQFTALIEDVKGYMLSAGVKPRVLNGESSIGCIARGVVDLWNYGAGEGKFSEVFYQRVIQLATPMSDIEDGSEDLDFVTEEDIDDIFDGDESESEGPSSDSGTVNDTEYVPMTKEDYDALFENI